MAFSVSVSATESEVNIANNTSKLTVSLTLNSTYGSWFGDTKYGTIVIDGTSYGISYNFPSGTTSKNIGSASKVITHNNATGAYTAGWSYSIPTNSSQGTKTGSGSTTLTTIARASEPSLSATSVNLNTKVTINTNYKNTSFRHTITYSIGNASGRIGNDKGVADKVDWTPPYSLADQFPNATSGNVTITCQTYNGNTLVGTKTCTLTVKTVDTTEFKPTIRLSASYTGKFNNNYLLNGISGITVSATTGFKHGATLSSYTISGASKSSTKAALSLSPINVSMTSATTTLTFSGTITDSRGYTNTASNLTATVYRYNKPQIKSCNVYRCKSSTDSTASSNGTYAAVVITYTYQNDGYSNSMSTKKITINNIGEYNLTTTETISNGVVTGTGTTIVGNGHLLITTSYPYTVTCKDAVNQTTTVTGSLPTADRIWDVRPQGKGLSVGKFAEHDNMVESAWEVKAPKFTGTNSTAPQFVGTATNAQNAQTDTTDPDNQTMYYPTFTTGSGNQRQRINGGVLYYFKKGTSSVQGETFLRLGNGTASGTAGNKKGFIQLYGPNTGKAELVYKNTTTNVTHTLPAISGTYQIQRAMAQIRYKRQQVNVTSGWGIGVPLTSIDSTMTLGSGLSIDSNKIKINNSTIKKVKITACVESFGRNQDGDTGYGVVRVSSSSNIKNIFYVNYNHAYYWHAGSSVTFILDVAQNQTYAIYNWANIATMCEHLGAVLLIEDVTEY